MLPLKRLGSKFDSATNRYKVNKERVMLLTYNNASGIFKMPLLVIGKEAKARALKISI